MEPWPSSSRMALVQARPSMTGISMSISMTSKEMSEEVAALVATLVPSDSSCALSCHSLVVLRKSRASTP